MDIRIATLGPRAARKHASAEEMFSTYCERIGHHCRCETQNFPTEEKFFAATTRDSGRPKAVTLPGLVLLDSRGRTFSSEQFADWLRRERDQGTQRLVFAVGPASGWSEPARMRAGLLLSLGPMTLPHELAAVVLAEQIYRAFTIIEGHPYHVGHAGG
jgi:23S rRNA (pseudouridine1915-N3)-methyltransferase